MWPAESEQASDHSNELMATDVAVSANWGSYLEPLKEASCHFGSTLGAADLLETPILVVM